MKPDDLLEIPWQIFQLCVYFVHLAFRLTLIPQLP